MIYILFSYLFLIGMNIAKTRELNIDDYLSTVFAPITFPIMLGIKFFNWNEKKN